jgi:hypothetical protein
MLPFGMSNLLYENYVDPTACMEVPNSCQIRRADRSEVRTVGKTVSQSDQNLLTSIAPMTAAADDTHFTSSLEEVYSRCLRTGAYCTKSSENSD